MSLSPVTYFSRGVRAVVGAGDAGAAGVLGGPVAPLVLLTGLAVVTLAAGAVAIPTTD
jgi:ABC-2 type transport system permease protein